MSTQGFRRTLYVVVDRAGSSLWFVPTAMVATAIALSTALLFVDERLALERPAAQSWLFRGSAEAARTLLSVVAGSLITVISVAFSVTMIAIQQASTQYTPRVLRNYTKDRGNQLVLGTYLATFTYALVVLREVRGEDGAGGAFVPAWSILVAMLLALVSLGALIYFMHHVSESIQVSYLVSVIRAELGTQIAKIFPETFGERARDAEEVAEAARREESTRGREALSVESEQEGYLRRIDEAALAKACQGLELVVVPVKIGERLQRDTVVLRAWGPGATPDGRQARIRRAFQLDRHRSIEQDVLFGIRQLVDIAVKALSPSTNDPTTAEQALAEIVGALAVLVRREMPDPARRIDAHTRFLFAVPSFEDIVDESLSQIRRAAQPHLHVTVTLLDGLRGLAARAPSQERAEPFRWQAAQILDALPRAGFTSDDEAKVRRAAAAVLDAARGGPAAQGGSIVPQLH